MEEGQASKGAASTVTSVKSREAEAAARRDEQLRMWEQLDASPPRHHADQRRRIRFDWRAMFHAACAACDRDEARQLLAADDPANDVDCLNIDGLSALHQAAIDNNLEMVEFLVDLGANINVEDRESWTPLHATVNCGHECIARYFIDKGANLAAVNSDGNLPIDIAESDEMKSLIQQAIVEQGIDCESARKEEERVMTADAIYWAIEAHTLRHPHPSACKIDPETGTTALHVAAAKGYMQVMRLLIRCCKADLNVQDVDGWTALHAAAYWSQKDAIELLVSSGANVALKNGKGETYVDLASDDIAEYIKKLESEPANRKHAKKMLRVPFAFKRDKDLIAKKGKSCGSMCEVARIDEEIAMLDKAEKWAEDSMDDVNVEAAIPESDTGRTLLHKAAAKGYMKVMEVLITKCYLDIDAEDYEGWTPLHYATFYEQNDAVAYLISWGASTTIKNKKGDVCAEIASMAMKYHIFSVIMRMKNRRRLPPSDGHLEIAKKRQELKIKLKSYLANLQVEDKEKNNVVELSSDTSSDENIQIKETLEKPESSKDSIELAISAAEAGKKDDVNLEAQTKSLDILTSDDERKAKSPINSANEKVTTVNPSTVQPKLSPGNIFKNFFKSFVPPTRDEESATQRKAHAKRIRETRRSTQGISLEEIQNAELLIRKSSNNNNNPPTANSNSVNDTSATASGINRVTGEESAASVSETIQIPAPTHKPADISEDTGETECCTVAVTLPLNSTPSENNAVDSNTITTTATIATGGPERRPSWRLRLDSGCKFALEDVSKNDGDKNKATTNALNNNTEVSDSVTIPLRRLSLNEDKPPMDRVRTHSGKFLESVGTKNNIRRRSTGISQINSQPTEESAKKLLNNEDSIIDYKKLYERSQLEIERLNKIIKSYEEQFASKGNLDKSSIQSTTTTSTTSQEINEKEKREKRALQRKLSEMEEELRAQKALQTENQRLKDENGALIRVISKLSK